MRLSVVINTYNRGPSLRRTLRALRHQTCDRFEVVVVNGPSTDNTAAVLDEFAGIIRVGHCPEVHLSESRNVGIGLAGGAVVAFLDDDAIPEPTWAADLLAAYTDPSIGGAGGIVYDHTGFRLQYRYATCDRTGVPNFDAAPPFDAYTLPRADPFVYLQGTNASFRRECLVAIGGFDEEIEYYLDEVEVCMRVLDLGKTIRPLPHAAVHHKYLASHLRSPKKVILNPYPHVKNRCYFALQNGQGTRSLRTILRLLHAYADALRADCETHFAEGRLTAAQRRFFLQQVERGLHDGTERGLHGGRQFRVIPPAEPERFLPYPVLRPAQPRRTVCLLTPGPTEAGGGLARAAAELAAAGHVVHTVSVDGDTNCVDFEDGIWEHRLARPERHLPELDGSPVRAALLLAATCYHEVERIHTGTPIDIVAASQQSGAGRLCGLDPRFVVVDVDGSANSGAGGFADGLLSSCHARGTPTAAAVGAHVTAVLIEVAGLPRAAARRAAQALLDPACYPTDYLAQVLTLARGPDGYFVRGLFLLCLGREVDAGSLARYLRLLERGLPRRALLRRLALSPEAASNGLPLCWLPAAEKLLPHVAPPGRRIRLLDRVRVLATQLAWALKHRLRQRRAS